MICVPVPADEESALALKSQRNIVSVAVSAGVFASFLIYYGLLCIRPEWGGDFQLYCAGIARLYRDLLHPLHESLDLPSNLSTVHTPYLVGVAVLGKLSGVTPYGALQIAGIFNLLLFAGGACFLFSRVSLHRAWWLSAACFVFVTLFLRWRHFGWASELSLTNLQYIQPYPGTFAWGLALIAFGLVEGLRKAPSWRELAGLIAVLSLLLSSHVLTASWVSGMVGLAGLQESVQQKSWRPLAWSVGVVAVAVLPVLLWPYQPFLDQFGDTPLVRSMRFINRNLSWGKAPFQESPTLYGLALPCFAYLWWRTRRHGFWLLGLAATLGAMFLWRLLGESYGSSRYAQFAVFFPQLFVAEVLPLGLFALLGPLTELDPERSRPAWDRPLTIAALVAACTAWLPSPMRDTARQREDYGTLSSLRSILRRPSARQAYYAQFAGVAPHVSARDVVIMRVSRAVLDFAAITGASVVATPLGMRVPDANERFHAAARFFRSEIPGEERLATVHQYGATKILLDRALFELLPELTQTFGEPRYQGPDYALFDTEGF